MGFKEERELEEQYVMKTFGRKPVEFVRGKGMILQDSEGKEYYDFLSGIGVISLGHCHPNLVNAIKHQVGTLVHVSNYYYIENRGEVAHLLSDMMNEASAEADKVIWKTFFANSGAEANECAIKLARLYARKRFEAAGKSADDAPRTIVTLNKSFHGRTLATLAATAQPSKQEAFQPLPDGFTSVDPNDCEALEALFAQQGDSICAVMVECVQGESGVHPLTSEYVQTIRRLTQETGALFMCDEVQCGIYRCGTHPFGFQHFGVVPDVATVAKGIASGVPMGGCIARADVADAFDPGDHGSTFGGSNLAISAAKATLETLQQENFAQHVEEVGVYLRNQLSALPGVCNVRGLGLMVGLDLDETVKLSAPEIVTKGLENGLVLNATGPATMRFLPPLICSKEDVDVLIDRLGAILSGK